MMDTLFSAIDYKSPLWISVAFGLGFLMRFVGLPPLVGFLLAGFMFNALGFGGHYFLQEMADLGVTLLLFSIGLKLRLKELARPEIWGVTMVHMACLTCLGTLWLLLCQQLGLPLFDALNWKSAAVIGFAMSFSSTVFVVKVLETRGDMLAHYGRIAIGVLVVQDLAAVAFLAVTANKLPSALAAMLIGALILSRKYLLRLMNAVNQGELLVLFGLSMALGGAALFEAVDLKGDLGALVFGVMLSGQGKSEDLSKILFSMKELFLTGFFLSIGMAGLPNTATWIAVVLLLAGIPLKTLGFFLLFSRFHLRARTAVVSAVSLGNYSEFGLIVAAVGVSSGWLPESWLVVMAVLVAGSFGVSSVFNNWGDTLYTRFREQVNRFQHQDRLVGDENIDLSGIDVLVCGMGRVGGGAYDRFKQQGGYLILGLDYDDQVVARQNAGGRNTLLANFSSPDFWSRIHSDPKDLRMIVLCSPNRYTNCTTASLARNWGFKGFIAASSRYPGEEADLHEAGVNAVFNIFTEAGAGLAQHGLMLYASKPEDAAAVGDSPGATTTAAP